MDFSLMPHLRFKRLGVNRHIHIGEHRADGILNILRDGVRFGEAQVIIQQQMDIHQAVRSRLARPQPMKSAHPRVGSQYRLHPDLFFRKGLNSAGIHAFLDDDRWLLQGVGTYQSGSFYLTAGIGVDERNDAVRERYSLEGEYIPARSEKLRTALWLRIEHIATQQRDPTFIPYLAISSTNTTRHSFLLLVQYRAQSNNDALFVELGSLF